MFSFLGMKAFYKKALTDVLILVFLAAITGGCDNGTVGDGNLNKEGSLPPSLTGKWVEPQYGDWFNITSTTLEYGYDVPALWEGDIKFVSNYTANSGIIIIKYDTPPAPGSWDNGNDYHGIYYRDLDGIKVKLAGISGLEDTEALAEAIQKFTKNAVGNYVDWGIVPFYEKQ
jgi:hypothetical protein